MKAGEFSYPGQLRLTVTLDGEKLQQLAATMIDVTGKIETSPDGITLRVDTDSVNEQLRTFVDDYVRRSATTAECSNHKPTQHRDGKPPWCNACKQGDTTQPTGQDFGAQPQPTGPHLHL